jgi:hypothetical protein
MCVTLGLALTACNSASTAISPPAPISTTPGSGVAPEQETIVPTALPDGPLAPELTNETWLNSEPLRRADLSGKLVLIDFWTFG